MGWRLFKNAILLFEEIRSYGHENIWLCQMGRAATDNTFEQFQNKVFECDLVFNGLSVRWSTLRGNTLQFGWMGPFVCDGNEVPLANFKHYENPYCVAEYPAKCLEVRRGSEGLRLDSRRE